MQIAKNEKTNRIMLARVPYLCFLLNTTILTIPYYTHSNSMTDSELWWISTSPTNPVPRNSSGHPKNGPGNLQGSNVSTNLSPESWAYALFPLVLTTKQRNLNSLFKRPHGKRTMLQTSNKTMNSPKKSSSYHSCCWNRINVWYIYQHLVDFYSKM